MSKRMRSRCQDECEADVNMMRSLCQGECEADVKTNAKPMSGRPRSRCREGIRKWKHAVCEAYVKKNVKPMPVLFCEADVKTNVKPMSGWMRSRCHDNAKPMSRRMRSRCHDNAKPMSRRMWSRCQDECEADVKATAKPMSRRLSHAHTPNGSTHAHKQIDAKWKHAVRYVLSMFALITSLPSISLAQYRVTY